MAFIRKKKCPRGRTFYHVVESFREGKRVRQRTLHSLWTSPTIAEAIERIERGNKLWREPPAKFVQEIEKLRQIQQRTGLP